MPADARAPGCGKEGGPCCVASRANRFEVTCDKGLACVPPAGFYYRSAAQLERLRGANFGKGYADPSVVGACRRDAECNAPQGPCGADDCPGDPMACPAGFYCANYADATVGARCLPLPPSAGKEGGPCMPSNYPVRVLRGVCVRACPSLSRTALPSRRSALLLPLSLLPLDTT